MTFGRTGDEESLNRDDDADEDSDDTDGEDDDEQEGSGTPRCEEEDVNDDGLLDLVCEFDAQKAGFQVDDIEGILAGKTKDGTAILGVGSIVIEKDD